MFLNNEKHASKKRLEQIKKDSEAIAIAGIEDGVVPPMAKFHAETANRCVGKELRRRKR